jgi:hypothetical protein
MLQLANCLTHSITTSGCWIFLLFLKSAIIVAVHEEQCPNTLASIVDVEISYFGRPLFKRSSAMSCLKNVPVFRWKQHILGFCDIVVGHETHPLCSFLNAE